MKKSFNSLRGVDLILLIICSLLFAQTEYPHVMDNGGGKSENASYKNLASIGQAVIGIANTPSNINQAGYITAIDLFLEIKEDEFAEILPDKITIGQPYPNPFNSSCQIDISHPDPAEIQFQVFNLLGQNIFSEKKQSKGGAYNLIFNAENLASGVYLYKISIGNTISDGKFIFTK